MKRRVVVNGRPVEICLNGNGTFRPDDRERSASLVEAEPGVWSVLLDGRSYRVQVEDGACIVNGERLEVEIEDPRAPRRSKGSAAIEGRQTLKAAMPGKVVRLLVMAGEDVEEGQGIAVVEAMKMQNEVKSPKTGRVVSVDVNEGDTVSAGAVLAVVE